MSKRLSYTIPYKYASKKTFDSARTLSLIHPTLFSSFEQLQTKHSSYIIYLCSRSPWSLRRPIGVAKATISIPSTEQHNDSSAHAELEEDILSNSDAQSDRLAETDASKQTHYSTYFKYAPVTILFKFFNSSDFLTLESRFKYMRSLDVFKCFDSIYSHSISWACVGLQISKSDTQDQTRYDSIFDKLMQQANYNQTNGIVVGPEVSRIFAEIILQAIDCRAINLLASKVDSRNIGDYAVRRYMDDYFIFFNNPADADMVQAALAESLEVYGLAINQKKTKEVSRPFVNELQFTRREICRVVDEWVDFAASQSISGIRSRSPLDLFNAVRLLIANNKTEVELVVGTCLDRIFVSVRRLLSKSTEVREEVIEVLLSTAISLCAFDMRYGTSHKIGKIIDEITTDASRNDKYGSMILRHINKLINSSLSHHSPCPLTLTNLLIFCAPITGSSTYLRPTIQNLINRFPNCSADYFQSASIIYITQYQAEFEAFRQSAVNSLLEAMNEPGADCNASVFYRSVDFLLCPYLSKPQKNAIKDRFFSLLMPHCTEGTTNKWYAELRKCDGFFCWNTNIPNSEFLMKKKLQTSYR